MTHWVVTPQVDLLYTCNHTATMCAELCTLIDKDPRYTLAAKLLWEIGWLEAGYGGRGQWYQ